VIDAHIVWHRDRYFMFFKDERGWSVVGTQFKGIAW
jgi:hypothetical protein